MMSVKILSDKYYKPADQLLIMGVYKNGYDIGDKRFSVAFKDINNPATVMDFHNFYKKCKERWLPYVFAYGSDFPVSTYYKKLLYGSPREDLIAYTAEIIIKGPFAKNVNAGQVARNIVNNGEDIWWRASGNEHVIIIDIPPELIAYAGWSKMDSLWLPADAKVEEKQQEDQKVIDNKVAEEIIKQAEVKQVSVQNLVNNIITPPVDTSTIITQTKEFIPNSVNSGVDLSKSSQDTIVGYLQEVALDQEIKNTVKQSSSVISDINKDSNNIVNIIVGTVVITSISILAFNYFKKDKQSK